MALIRAVVVHKLNKGQHLVPATWSIRLENLHVLDADEEGIFSDGDEPYLVAIGFRSKFQTPGSTQVTWRGMLDDEWAEGADDNETFPIPERMGVITFPGVEEIGKISAALGRKPELIGAFVAAFESDATPFRDIRAAIKDVLAALKPGTGGGGGTQTGHRPEPAAGAAGRGAQAAGQRGHREGAE